MRDITSCKSCLYRGPGVTETAVDMSFEVDKLKRIFHSHKRPADSSSLPGESPQKRRRILPEPDIPQLKLPLTLSPTLSTTTVRTSHRPNAKIIDLSDTDTEISTANVTTEIQKIYTPKATDLSNDSRYDKDSVVDEAALALLPSSKHATWPLKYVRPMAKGFSKMSSMSTGTASERFTIAFGLEWKKVTWNTHSNIWEAASDEIKGRYIEAGFTQSGLWKNFVKEVRGMYDGGRIPGKREMKETDKKRHQDGHEPQDDAILINE